jgi:RNA polymerase sigma-70 factor (sigma-E family)
VTGRPVDAPPSAAATPSAAAANAIPAALDLRDVERETAITQLFDRHHAQLVRLAALMGADHDAEDVVAEAFCELHHRWRKLRDPQAAPAYLRSVVCNLTRMRLRHLQVVRRHHEAPPRNADSAESEAVLREDQREVLAALRTLPQRQREALVLRYWLGLREAEVAASMGISAGAVKSHTSRAMAALNRELEGRR